MAANLNRFTLLDDDEEDDFTAAKYSSTVPVSSTKATPPPPAKKPPPQEKPSPAKLPSKPLPPAEAVKAERDSQQAERGRGRGRARPRRGPNGDGWTGGEGSGDAPFTNRSNPSRGESYNQGRSDSYNQGRGESYNQGRGEPYNQGRGESYNQGRDSFSPAKSGGRRGGYRSFGDSGEGEGERGYEGGGGRGRSRRGGESWDPPPPAQEPGFASQEEAKEPEAVKDEQPETEEKQPEKREMTLDEYYDKMSQKKVNLPKAEARKAEVDVEFQKMQLVDKKHDDDYIKLGAEKEKSKKRDTPEKEKKAVPINEFLKPVRGRGRGRGYGRGYPAPVETNPGADDNNGALSPSIDNPQDFPELGK